jgi:hypothetical protein
MNQLLPVDAYRYFLRGYTRPARYIDGIVLQGEFKLPVDFRPEPLRVKYDQELVDFFEGFEYRWDIIDRIDQEVRDACSELRMGRFVKSGLRHLVCYAVWGNPVDAYKWYEYVTISFSFDTQYLGFVVGFGTHYCRYNLQHDYLAHTYLPEHVILGELPKAPEYSKPNPSGMGCSHRHMQVRYRMARANDEGIGELLVFSCRLLISVASAKLYTRCSPCSHE